MRVFRFALEDSMRQTVRSALADKTLEGSVWLKCQIRYSGRLIVFCLVVALVSVVAWLIPPNYDAIAWLVAVGYAGALAILYLLSLAAWRLFRSGLYFVIHEGNLLEIKNWLVGMYPVSEILKITLAEGRSITEGEIRLRRGRRRFGFQSPLKDKMTSFFRTLAARIETLRTSPQHDSPRSARMTLLMIAFILVVASLSAALIPAVLSTARNTIDSNNYSMALSRATASSLRQYLRDDRNRLFRIAAEKSLKGLYDEYIAKLSKATGDKVAVAALHDILVYLRDHDQYVVLMDFHSSSQLQESPETGLSIRPIASVFDSAGRSALEGEVSNSINKGFAGMFPADIVTIGELSSAVAAPALRVDYSYSNSNYVYYPSSQKDLPLEKRTLYYGLKIDWRIQVVIPSRNATTIEVVQSEPADTFDYAEGSTDAMIYQRMAETAFQDLSSRINKSMGL
jgi:hypothetical protein